MVLDLESNAKDEAQLAQDCLKKSLMYPNTFVVGYTIFNKAHILIRSTFHVSMMDDGHLPYYYKNGQKRDWSKQQRSKVPLSVLRRIDNDKS